MNEIANLLMTLTAQRAELNMNIQTSMMLSQMQQQVYEHGIVVVPNNWNITSLHYERPSYNMPTECCYSGPKKTNCCNCGASLRGRIKCEYCGTVNS